MIRNILTLIRIKDWSKNVIIFLPLIFSENLKNDSYYLDLFLVFILFSLTSSFIYIINDIVDIKNDKKHLLKLKKKPLASGKISIKISLFILLLIAVLLISFLQNYKLLYPHVIFYLLINISYSLFFKRLPIIDVLLISVGYLIRLDVGSVVINVQTSLFLAGTIFFLACFIIFIKRYIEIKNNNSKSTTFYSEKNLKIFIFLSSIFFFLTLSFFTFIIDLRLIILIPFLVLIFVRYYKSSITYNLGEFPLDLILKDKIILFCSSLVIIYTIVLFY